MPTKVEVPKKATPTDDKKPARSHQVKLEIKATKDEQFWVGWTWDAKKPQYLVICNYPSNENEFQLDVTKMLVINHILGAGGGGVMVGNLFSKFMQKPTEHAMAVANTELGIKELVLAAQQADKVIIGTGAITDKSKVADARLNVLIDEMKAGGIKEVQAIVNPKTKSWAHPLSLQGQQWGLINVTL